MTNRADFQKQANGVGVVGSLLAAGFLVRMLDSHREEAQAARATRLLRAMMDSSEKRRSMHEEHHGPQPTIRPRLFIPAQHAANEEEEGLRYQMGFVPNVPVGMDQGMVRLASEEAVAEKLARLFGPGLTKEGGAAGVLSGLLLGGAGISAGIGARKATEILDREATPTDWSQVRFGAPRLAKTTNEYGFPQYTR